MFFAIFTAINTTRLASPTEIEHLKTVLKLLRNCLKLYI